LTADELVLGEEAIVRRLRSREVLAQREEILEAITDNLQTRQSARRARLECRVVAAERWVKVVYRNRERRRAITRAALRNIRDGRLGHKFLVVVPERLFMCL
jgi:hypothetical protein